MPHKKVAGMATHQGLTERLMVLALDELVRGALFRELRQHGLRLPRAAGPCILERSPMISHDHVQKKPTDVTHF